MRKAYAGLATLLVLVVVAQFSFAASGAFSSAPGSFRPHHVLGYVIFSLAIVMTVVAALARMSARLVWLPLVVAGLTGVEVVVAKVAQSLGDDSTVGPLVFGTHAVIGMAIAAVAGMIVQQALTLYRFAGAAQRTDGVLTSGR